MKAPPREHGRRMRSMTLSCRASALSGSFLPPRAEMQKRLAPPIGMQAPMWPKMITGPRYRWRPASEMRCNSSLEKLGSSQRVPPWSKIVRQLSQSSLPRSGAGSEMLAVFRVASLARIRAATCSGRASRPPNRHEGPKRRDGDRACVSLRRRSLLGSIESL